MASKGAAGAAPHSGDPQPKSKSKSRSKSKSEPKPSHGGGGGSGENKKPTSNPNPQHPEPRKASSETPKSPSKPPAAAMASDRSPDAGKSQRKRKAGGGEPLDSPSKPSNDGSGVGSGKGRASDSKAIYQDDCITILRAAIEFRKRTGAAPTNSQISKFYKSVEGSLRSELSEKQVWNRLRTLRSNMKNAAANGHGADPVQKLSMELWPFNDVKQEHKEKKEEMKEEEDAEEDRKQKKAKKGDKANEEGEKKSLQSALANGSVVQHDEDMDEEEDKADEDPDEDEDEEEKPKAETDEIVAKDQLPTELEAFPYLAQAIEENWKKQGFPEASLDGLKVDPARAKVLEDKWKKCISEDMRYRLECARLDMEIRELMYGGHNKI